MGTANCLCSSSTSQFVFTEMLSSILTILLITYGGQCAIPNCTVKRGHSIGELPAGQTVEEVLEHLRTQFCGCTHVYGNVVVNMVGVTANSTMNESDFNMFYYLEEITGSLLFNTVPAIPRLILPNLRIVRGQESWLSSTILLLNVNAAEVIFPSLTEVSQGDVNIIQPIYYSPLCNLAQVNWADILDRGRILGLFEICKLNKYTNNCSRCPGNPQYCWAEGYCQTLRKIDGMSNNVTECGNGRYYVDARGVKQCCHPHCSAGCDGPSPERCFACRNLVYNGTCVTLCPPAIKFDVIIDRVVPNPTARLRERGFCVNTCSDGLVVENETCLSCNVTTEGCPRECFGLEQGEVINATTLAALRGCDVIIGDLNIGPFPGEFNHSNLEVLSTIKEITGVLSIDNYTEASFPYLRNLRIVGSFDVPDLLLITDSCGGESNFLVSIFISMNALLTQVDLSSLEEIRGGGVYLTRNPNLCYFGDLVRYINGSYHSCVDETGRKDPDQCSQESYECHIECNSTLCWGPEDHQCNGMCRNYTYQGRCVPDCNMTDAWPGQIIAVEERMTCEYCHHLCSEGCTGPMDPRLCVNCRTLFVQELSKEKDDLGFTCVDSCPHLTYQSGRVCLPCHDFCGIEAGCVGPAPFMDSVFGCRDCSLVKLTSSGTQDYCVLDNVCNSTSFYRTVLSSAVLNSNVSGLELGSEVCVPCNETCDRCNGPESVLGPNGCQSCRYAQRWSQCVRECDTTEYFETTNRTCVQCSPSCNGCRGPYPSDCVWCASGYYQVFSLYRTSFICVSDCGVLCNDGARCISCPITSIRIDKTTAQVSSPIVTDAVQGTQPPTTAVTTNIINQQETPNDNQRDGNTDSALSDTDLGIVLGSSIGLVLVVISTCIMITALLRVVKMYEPGSQAQPYNTDPDTLRRLEEANRGRNFAFSLVRKLTGLPGRAARVDKRSLSQDYATKKDKSTAQKHHRRHSSVVQSTAHGTTTRSVKREDQRVPKRRSSAFETRAKAEGSHGHSRRHSSAAEAGAKKRVVPHSRSPHHASRHRRHEARRDVRGTKDYAPKYEIEEHHSRRLSVVEATADSSRGHDRRHSSAIEAGVKKRSSPHHRPLRHAPKIDEHDKRKEVGHHSSAKDHATVDQKAPGRRQSSAAGDRRQSSTAEAARGRRQSSAVGGGVTHKTVHGRRQSSAPGSRQQSPTAEGGSTRHISSVDGREDKLMTATKQKQGSSVEKEKHTRHYDDTRKHGYREHRHPSSAGEGDSTGPQGTRRNHRHHHRQSFPQYATIKHHGHRSSADKGAVHQEDGRHSRTHRSARYSVDNSDQKHPGHRSSADESVRRRSAVGKSASTPPQGGTKKHHRRRSSADERLQSDTKKHHRHQSSAGENAATGPQEKHHRRHSAADRSSGHQSSADESARHRSAAGKSASTPPQGETKKHNKRHSSADERPQGDIKRQRQSSGVESAATRPQDGTKKYHGHQTSADKSAAAPRDTKKHLPTDGSARRAISKVPQDDIKKHHKHVDGSARHRSSADKGTAAARQDNTRKHHSSASESVATEPQDDAKKHHRRQSEVHQGDTKRHQNRHREKPQGDTEQHSKGHSSADKSIPGGIKQHPRHRSSADGTPQGGIRRHHRHHSSADEAPQGDIRKHHGHRRPLSADEMPQVGVKKHHRRSSSADERVHHKHRSSMPQGGVKKHHRRSSSADESVHHRHRSSKPQEDIKEHDTGNHPASKREKALISKDGPKADKTAATIHHRHHRSSLAEGDGIKRHRRHRQSSSTEGAQHHSHQSSADESLPQNQNATRRHHRHRQAPASSKCHSRQSSADDGVSQDATRRHYRHRQSPSSSKHHSRQSSADEDATRRYRRHRQSPSSSKHHSRQSSADEDATRRHRRHRQSSSTQDTSRKHHSRQSSADEGVLQDTTRRHRRRRQSSDGTSSKHHSHQSSSEEESVPHDATRRQHRHHQSSSTQDGKHHSHQPSADDNIPQDATKRHHGSSSTGGAPTSRTHRSHQSSGDKGVPHDGTSSKHRSHPSPVHEGATTTRDDVVADEQTRNSETIIASEVKEDQHSEELAKATGVPAKQPVTAATEDTTESHRVEIMEDSINEPLTGYDSKPTNMSVGGAEVEKEGIPDSVKELAVKQEVDSQTTSAMSLPSNAGETLVAEDANMASDTSNKIDAQTSGTSITGAAAKEGNCLDHPSETKKDADVPITSKCYDDGSSAADENVDASSEPVLNEERANSEPPIGYDSITNDTAVSSAKIETGDIPDSASESAVKQEIDSQTTTTPHGISIPEDTLVAENVDMARDTSDKVGAQTSGTSITGAAVKEGGCLDHPSETKKDADVPVTSKCYDDDTSTAGENIDASSDPVLNEEKVISEPPIGYDSISSDAVDKTETGDIPDSVSESAVKQEVDSQTTTTPHGISLPSNTGDTLVAENADMAGDKSDKIDAQKSEASITGAAVKEERSLDHPSETKQDTDFPATSKSSDDYVSTAGDNVSKLDASSEPVLDEERAISEPPMGYDSTTSNMVVGSAKVETDNIPDSAKVDSQTTAHGISFPAGNAGDALAAENAGIAGEGRKEDITSEGSSSHPDSTSDMADAESRPINALFNSKENITSKSTIVNEDDPKSAEDVTLSITHQSEEVVAGVGTMMNTEILITHPSDQLVCDLDTNGEVHVQTSGTPITCAAATDEAETAGAGENEPTTATDSYLNQPASCEEVTDSASGSSSVLVGIDSEKSEGSTISDKAHADSESGKIMKLMKNDSTDHPNETKTDGDNRDELIAASLMTTDVQPAGGDDRDGLIASSLMKTDDGELGELKEVGSLDSQPTSGGVGAERGGDSATLPGSGGGMVEEQVPSTTEGDEKSSTDGTT